MKYSIITVNYNNREGLRRTIESVVSQTFRDFEFIVIDGGSTDGSADVLREYDSKITYWVSEKDAGIYNAMNKGIRKATGSLPRATASTTRACSHGLRMSRAMPTSS